MTYLYVDSRETTVLQYADVAWTALKYEIGTFSIGDYMVMVGGNPRAIIERKSLLDLASSIKDGRLENLERVKKYCADNKPCTPMLLIEGRMPSNRGHKIGGIMCSALLSCIYKYVIVGGFSVVWSVSAESSALVLSDIMYAARNVEPITGSAIPVVKAPPTVEEQCSKAWQCWPAVGPLTAKKLMSWATIYQVLAQKNALNWETFPDLTNKEKIKEGLMQNLTRDEILRILETLHGIGKVKAAALFPSDKLFIDIPLESIPAPLKYRI